MPVSNDNKAQHLIEINDKPDTILAVDPLDNTENQEHVLNELLRVLTEADKAPIAGDITAAENALRCGQKIDKSVIARLSEALRHKEGMNLQGAIGGAAVGAAGAGCVLCGLDSGADVPRGDLFTFDKIFHGLPEIMPRMPQEIMPRRMFG